jgi:hypothetical protein
LFLFLFRQRDRWPVAAGAADLMQPVLEGAAFECPVFGTVMNFFPC